MIYKSLIFVFFLTLILTGIVKKYALAKQMLDVPNFRSSHKIPTPRGGGVAFVAVFLVTILYLMSVNTLDLYGGYTLLGSLFLVAFIGFYDDRSEIVAHWRILAQLFAGFLALYGIGFLPDITFYHWTIHQGYMISVLAVIYLVWMLNLYNFMDGIDGLASLEAISACIGASIIFWMTGYLSLTLVPLLLAMATTGFLYWNIPPAKIFMGDVGSSFLGFVFGILSLQSLFIEVKFFWCWLILLGVFIVDATVTLIYRAVQREKLYLAHCNHAYQHAAKRYNNHLYVTGGVVILNLFWLWPLAILVGLGYIDGFLGFVVSYAPLCVLAIQFDAGKVRS